MAPVRFVSEALGAEVVVERKTGALLVSNDAGYRLAPAAFFTPTNVQEHFEGAYLYADVTAIEKSTLRGYETCLLHSEEGDCKVSCIQVDGRNGSGWERIQASGRYRIYFRASDTPLPTSFPSNAFWGLGVAGQAFSLE